MDIDWQLECSACGVTDSAEGLKGVCPECGRPWLVRYIGRSHPLSERGGFAPEMGMWQMKNFLPLLPGELPVTLGEGGTPLHSVPRLAASLGIADLHIKDESVNPTGSFKARGMSAAVTRAVAAGASAFVLPTAGNAGVAASAYGACAGVPVKVFAPATTPATIVSQIRSFGGDLELVDGHIGDCGRKSREYSADTGALDLSTLREPYRIEGKKTLALEIAMQLDWTLPDAIVYPTGGGTGLIGMWKGFKELRDAGWVTGELPRMYVVQSDGCAPLVKALASGAAVAEAWPDPVTAASGLRVPSALGDRLVLEAVRSSGGAGVAVSDRTLLELARTATQQTGIDFCPEGGAALAGSRALLERGDLRPDDRVVVCNTGAGWLYRGA